MPANAVVDGLTWCEPGSTCAPLDILHQSQRARSAAHQAPVHCSSASGALLS